MAVNNIVIGPNSHRIQYGPATALADLRAAVEAAILASHGWEVHDAAAGTNAVCYRALNADGITYKYVVLDFNTAGYMLLKAFESWNSTTHVGTNQCYLMESTNYNQRVDLTNGGNIYIFVSPRWLAAVSYNNGVIGSSSGQSFTGCFERTRVEDELASGSTDLPPFIGAIPGWINGMLNLPGFSAPRIKSSNFVGINAFCRLSDGIRTLANCSSNPYLPYPNQPSPWTGKYVVRDIVVAYNNAQAGSSSGVGNDEPLGKLYGLKVTARSVGTILDEMTINLDANYFCDPAGSPAGCWLLTEAANANAGYRYVIPK